jgi:hypothetical protein
MSGSFHVNLSLVLENKIFKGPHPVKKENGNGLAMYVEWNHIYTQISYALDTTWNEKERTT